MDAAVSRPLPPYARAMGMEIVELDGAAAGVAMDFGPHALGRPGYLHGGVIGGLLEIAGFLALHEELERQGSTARPKPVNVSIEYLRGGIAERIFAQGEIIRAGRRVANVRAEAWQGDRGKLVASCWMNFLLAPAKEG